jgi:hypothetical protein
MPKPLYPVRGGVSPSWAPHRAPAAPAEETRSDPPDEIYPERPAAWQSEANYGPDPGSGSHRLLWIVVAMVGIVIVFALLAIWNHG